jgi:hypothetical protein
VDNLVLRFFATLRMTRKRIIGTESIFLFQNPIRGIQVVIQNSVFANPGQRGHGGLMYKKVKGSFLTLTLLQVDSIAPRAPE